MLVPKWAQHDAQIAAFVHSTGDLESQTLGTYKVRDDLCLVDYMISQLNDLFVFNKGTTLKSTPSQASHILPSSQISHFSLPTAILL